MSRGSKWLRTLFAGKKSDSDSDSHPFKKKWPFPFMFKSRGRKLKEKHPSQSAAHKPQQSINNENIELQGRSREAVRVTGRRKYSTTCDGPRGGTAVVGYTYRRDKDLRWAVVTIQSHFRGYLSRRALLALKALVKLQALVRGHILRKQMGNVMRQMEALARAQTRARLGRVLNSQVQRHSSPKSTGPMTPQRIIEVDTWRTESTPRRRRRMFHSSDLSYCPSFSTFKDSTACQTNLSGEVQSFRHLKHGGDDSTFYTPDSSPKVYSSASSGRGGTFTPDKSESYRSRLTGSANHPNYMSYTESSKAKVRSFSAPKQRPNYEPVQAYADTRPYVYKASALHAIFSHKAYPGSGRLDRLGEP